MFDNNLMNSKIKFKDYLINLDNELIGELYHQHLVHLRQRTVQRGLGIAVRPETVDQGLGEEAPRTDPRWAVLDVLRPPEDSAPA